MSASPACARKFQGRPSVLELAVIDGDEGMPRGNEHWNSNATFLRGESRRRSRCRYSRSSKSAFPRAAEVAVRRGTEVQLAIAGRPGHRGPSNEWLSVTLQPPFARFAALKSIHLAKHFGKIGEGILGA